MLKLTKTGIGLLSKQYRSVLRKCLRINAGLFIALMIQSQLAPAVAGGVVLGDGTSAENSRNVAIGKNAQALGIGSTAVGYNALANGDDSHGWNVAIGDNANASGGTSISIGPSSASIGWKSISIGVYAETGNLAEGSVALGSYSVANENYIVSVGSSTIKRRIVNVAAGQNDNDVVILKQLNDALNYYYTFRVGERVEAIDSASFFQKDFSTLQEVDLQSKNPTHLGAFTKCDEACPRPSERFASLLSQEQMLKNDASVDAGTSRHYLRQFGDVVADLLKNTAAKSLRIYEFMNEEVRHA